MEQSAGERELEGDSNVLQHGKLKRSHRVRRIHYRLTARTIA